MENILHYINKEGYLSLVGDSYVLNIANVGTIKIIESTDTHEVIYFEDYDVFFKRNCVNLKYFAKYTSVDSCVRCSEWYKVKPKTVSKVIFQ